MERAAYASDPARSRGREFVEDRLGPRGPRGEFQRDRDRILHSIAFRRLAGKTQVFIAPDGDHYRVRLTHSLEVAQIGRVIARALGLDEDLTEALCLAHDIGHPPFGHPGEEALSAAMEARGGFDHNEQCLRTLMRLDSPYCGHAGLNLCWETLEGLAKHNGPARQPGWALEELDAAFPLDLARQPSLEAQVAALADDIAYDNHDIDDGIRAGLFALDTLAAVPMVAELAQGVRARFEDIDERGHVAELVRDQIGSMVNDVIEESRRRLQSTGVSHIEDVRSAGRPLVGFSAPMADAERTLKAFLYDRMYRAAPIQAIASEAKKVIAELFDAYRGHPALLPAEWQQHWPDETAMLRTIGDFVAGMTDRYAITQYRQHVGPVALPDTF